MYILLTYDVSKEDSGEKRLRKVAKLCEKYGMRVQYSVFECEITPEKEKILIDSLLKIINKSKDTIRIYYLGNNYKTKIKILGGDIPLTMNDTMIF